MQKLTANGNAHSYLRVLKRWWWLPVLFAVLSAGITYAGTKALIKPEYGATVQLQLQSTSGSSSASTINDANAAAINMTGASVISLTRQTISSCSPSRPMACSGLVNLPTKLSPARTINKPKKSTKAQTKPHIPAWVTTHRFPLWVKRTIEGYQRSLSLARRDPRALNRVSCAADSTDQFVTCTTTSRHYRVPPKTLNILTQVFQHWNESRIQKNYHAELKSYNSTIASFQTRIDSLQKSLKGISQGSLEYQTRQNQISSLQSQQSNFKGSKLDEHSLITGIAGLVSVTSWAAASQVPVSPHPARNALLGAIVGIAIAAALIVLLEYLDDTFRSTDEVFETIGLPLLGAVRKYEGTPAEMGMVAARMPRTAIAEAYRVARANIQFTELGANLKVLAITSARDGEGKTTTANNLATTFALAGQRVLLVDADLRRPGLTKMLSMRDMHGLSSVLLDPDADVIRATDVVGMSVVPSGAIPPNPAELLGSPLMRAWIERVAGNFDLIMLDTPPVLSVADTRILATVADAVILVLDPALTTRRMARQARLAVENVGGRLLGIMLNRDVMRGEGYYYNYYYYEKSAYGKADREREARRSGR